MILEYPVMANSIIQKKKKRKQMNTGAKLKELPAPQTGALWDTKIVGMLGLQPINRINIIPY